MTQQVRNHPCPHTGTRAGFTLVELSIVITIVGLIVTAVLVGQDLIESARVTKGISQVNEYMVATHTFRTKYGYLPGDYPKAVSYWGAANTENGNGDDVILAETAYIAPSCFSGALDVNSEPILYWQHLSLAEMIDFETVKPTGTPRPPGVLPEFELVDESHILATCFGYPESAGSLPPLGRGGHVFILGVGGPLSAVANTYPWQLNTRILYTIPFFVKVTFNDGPQMTVYQSYAFDMKIDDGIANRGKIKVVSGCNAYHGVSTPADYTINADNCFNTLVYLW